MALTINTQILGQVATSTTSYCYLYEPLGVVISEDNLDARKLFIDLEVIDASNNTSIIETLLQYGEYDINPGQGLSIDLMRIARQHHDANILNFSHINEIVDNVDGWKSVVSKYIYNFKFYTDITLTTSSVKKLPILGGRNFTDFVPTVNQTNPLTEADLFGVNLDDRWLGYPVISNELVVPTILNAAPIINKTTATEGKVPCGGFLIWKSRLGGWMTWGFHIKNNTSSFKYTGNLDSDMFFSTKEIDGNAFIPVDYTGIEMSYTISLKDLSLSSNELLAVNSINSSPAIYYMKDNTGALELMKLASASVPLSSQANGGDFSVTLNSISVSKINTK